MCVIEVLATVLQEVLRTVVLLLLLDSLAVGWAADDVGVVDLLKLVQIAAPIELMAPTKLFVAIAMLLLLTLELSAEEEVPMPEALTDKSTRDRFDGRFEEVLL